MVPFLKAIPVSSALKTFLLSTNFVPDSILGSEERKINIVGFFLKALSGFGNITQKHTSRGLNKLFLLTQ